MHLCRPTIWYSINTPALNCVYARRATTFIYKTESHCANHNAKCYNHNIQTITECLSQNLGQIIIDSYSQYHIIVALQNKSICWILIHSLKCTTLGQPFSIYTELHKKRQTFTHAPLKCLCVQSISTIPGRPSKRARTHIYVLSAISINGTASIDDWNVYSGLTDARRLD